MDKIFKNQVLGKLLWRFAICLAIYDKMDAFHKILFIFVVVLSSYILWRTERHD